MTAKSLSALVIEGAYGVKNFIHFVHHIAQSEFLPSEEGHSWACQSYTKSLLPHGLGGAGWRKIVFDFRKEHAGATAQKFGLVLHDHAHGYSPEPITAKFPS